MVNQTVEAAPVIETSMSSLDLFTRCRRAFMYRDVRGWQSRETSSSMAIGTGFHVALAAGYNAVRRYDDGIALWGDRRSDNTRALEFIEAAVEAAQTVERDRDGKNLGFTKEDYELLEDMVRYWFEQTGENDLANIDAILSVEEPIYMQVKNYLIRCTLDVVVKYNDQDDIVIKDHKTGDPQTTKAWIGLDIQTGMYYVAARGRYGKVTHFFHNFVDRSVPPGFGHRSLLTDTGKERSKATLESMQDPAKYIGATFTTLSDSQLNAYTLEIVEIIEEIDHAKETNRWPRTRTKIGPMACDKCPYFSPCQVERDGKEVGEAAAAMLYIIKGSDEEKALKSN